MSWPIRQALKESGNALVAVFPEKVRHPLESRGDELGKEPAHKLGGKSRSHAQDVHRSPLPSLVLVCLG